MAAAAARHTEPDDIPHEGGRPVDRPQELDWLNEPVQPMPAEQDHYLAGPFAGVVSSLLARLRGGRLHGLGLNISCCGPEMLATTARYNLNLHAPSESDYPESVRRANLLVVCGTINEKLADPLIVVHNRLAEPKYVVAMGACACTGGPYWDTYNIIDGVHKLFPVDVYVGGCPPPPEALMLGLWMVQEMAEGRVERGQRIDPREPMGGSRSPAWHRLLSRDRQPYH